jgi:hypothetical protein
MEEPAMADPRNPNEPRRSHIADDPYRTDLADADTRNAARLDNELQPDPELAEGPASGSRVAIFAVAIAVVLGAVFYGLNHSSINPAGTSSTAQTALPAAPPGMPDVTPRANTGPGVTTGAAPANPQAPQAAPSSSTIPNNR